MSWTERDITMFRKAVPVWHNGGLNTHLLFTVTLDDLTDTVLRIAAADFYALYVDGVFLGWGPARTAAGYARVDEYRLTGIDGDGIPLWEGIEVRSRRPCRAVGGQDGRRVEFCDFEFHIDFLS